MASTGLKIFANFLLVIFVITIEGATIKETDLTPVKKLSSGVYFREHSHLIPYEGTVPLFFKVRFPTFDVKNPGPCKEHDIVCHTQKATYDLAQEMKNFVVDTGNPRKKRQIIAMAAGAAGALLLESIFSRISSKLFGSEREAVDHLYEVQKSYELKNYGMNVNITHILMDEIKRSRRYSILWETYDQTTQRELLYFIEMQAVSTKIEFGIERCSNNLIPTQFITTSTLKKSLIKLNEVVNAKGYTLSIPYNNVYEYLKINLADCFITPKNSYVMLNIPIVKTVWRVFELVPVAFRYRNQTCNVDRPQNDVVAVSKDGRVEIIDNTMSGLCDIVSDNLCMIPKFSKNDACPLNLYRNASYDVINLSCHVKCLNSTTLTMYNVEKDLVHVVNADSIEINCGGIRKGVSTVDYGAIEIPVECNCKYLINGREYDLGESCIESSGRNETSHVAPWWFNISNHTQSLQNDPKNFTQFDDKINEVLAANTPDSSVFEMDGWHYRDYWLVGLSCGIVCLLVICILFCWCNNK